MSPNAVYQGKITSIQPNYKDKAYFGVAEKSFLQPHQILYPYWGIKRNNFITKVTWGILREYPPYNLSKRKCYLSLNEKLEINSYKGNNLLNKSSELIKYRLKVQTPKQTYVITT